MAGELKKLKIEAYSGVELLENDKVDEFVVMFNPASYSQRYEVEYEENQGQGTTGNAKIFGSIKPQEYNFEFLLDGTGAVTPPVIVADEVERFLVLTGKMDGDIHRPLFLKISWGYLLSKCVLKSATITYTLFQPDGYPLRAKINAVFSESIDETLRVAEEGKNSPDLTHMRTPHQDDVLPLMTHRIYGTPFHYAEVARENDLNHFRRLTAGRALRFPPLANLYLGEDT